MVGKLRCNLHKLKLIGHSRRSVIWISGLLEIVGNKYSGTGDVAFEARKEVRLRVAKAKSSLEIVYHSLVKVTAGS